MDIEQHQPTCTFCKSTEVTDVEHDTRQIGAGTWQGGDASRAVPFVRFRCLACGKPNQYDVPEGTAA